MAKVRDNGSHQTNPNLRKAAIVLMSLPEDDAAQLMGRMSPKEVEAVCIEIAHLDRLTGQEQETAILSFAEQNPNQLAGAGGGISLAKNLVTRALGKGANETLDNVRQSVESIPFGFLRKVDSQNLLTFIVDEHPQTIALILSHLPASYGAEIISGLPADRQLSVIRRIANMGQTNPEVIEEVEKGLETRMASVMSQSFENAGGVPTVAEILNVTDRATERALLEHLAQEDPDLVEEIRRLMFVFDDIQKLADKDMQAVLKNVESAQWAMALKGASQELRDKVVGNMSKRAADMLLEEMDFLGAVKVSEVEGVQQQIVDIVRRLEDAGEIALSAGDEEEQLVQ
ncbi:flagellar motor switch protein FliG [Blastopirellula marina]|uniref:Flagellar motor switch protein FliG n=1 Tax=Blastopirellula marina DSM 3645 TaxID=314230 RepID=A3ZPG2_9BACT|nr:flagellar motor switch protein FliG [Blastopirellula marina]EAQ81640.1 flagellar motor switch protein fliG [Blastopirellula marina DSM 3645]